MTCHKHGPTCPNFEKRMDAEAKAGRLRVEVDAARGEAKRLRGVLATVGCRDVEAPEYRPPDTRPGCWVQTELGACGLPALAGGLCSAHEAEEVGL